MLVAFNGTVPTDTEAGKLAEVHARAFGKDAAWRAAEFNSGVTAPNRILIADADLGASVLVLQLGGDEAEILTLGVVPSARRNGLAQAMVEHGAELAKRQGVARMFLEVAVDNTPAISLYERIGFAAVGRRKRYFRRADGDRVDAIAMALRL